MFKNILLRLAVVVAAIGFGACGAMDASKNGGWQLVGKGEKELRADPEKPGNGGDPKKGGRKSRRMPRVARRDWRKLTPAEMEEYLGFTTTTKQAEEPVFDPA